MTFIGMEEEADCTPCSGGYYCDLPGMITPVDLCTDGYFCKQNARTATPDQGILVTLHFTEKKIMNM